jgi:hypothetical protein
MIYKITSASEIELVTILQVFTQLIAALEAHVAVPEDAPKSRRPSCMLKHVAAAIARTSVGPVAPRV